MQNDPQDFIAFVIALLTLIVSREIASLIGPYFAFCVAAAAGAGLSLSWYDKPLTSFQACWYVFIRVLIALVLTVSLAEFLQVIMAWAKPRATLIPLAFLLGCVKDFETIKTWMDKKILKRANKIE